MVVSSLIACKFEPVSLGDLSDPPDPTEDPDDEPEPEDSASRTDDGPPDTDEVFAACDATLYGATQVVTTNRQGFATVEVEVDGYRSVLLQADPVDDVAIAAWSVLDERGDEAWSLDAWSGDEIWGGAAVPDARTVINFPSRAADGPIVDGTWTFEFVVIDAAGYGVPGAEVNVEAFFKEDPDLTSSCLPVRVVYARDRDDADTRAAVLGALARFMEVYAAVGISVIPFEELSSNLPPDVPRPGDGDARYTDLSRAGAVTLVVGDTVDGSMDILGQAGGIPGAVAVGPQSVVAIAAALHAGANGRFNEAEIATMGETMAHEVGHYLGLVHPVQYDDALNVVAFDAIDDTRTCSDVDECDQRLGQNLMYPYSGRSQYELTEAQTGVMHRYVGVQ